jgi:hypothetical protein
MRIFLTVAAIVVLVVMAIASYTYFEFPPAPVRRMSGPPPLFSFTLKEASGFFIDDAGDLMTTRDAVADCRRLNVAGQGFNAAPAIVQALPSRPEVDLALVRVSAKPAGTVSLVDVPDPLPPETAKVETGPFNVVGFRGVPQNADNLQQPAFIPVAPQGMVSAPDHSTYLGFAGGLPSAMAGGALIDGRNRVIGVYAGNTTASAPSGATQIIGGAILSGEALQLLRSAGIRPNIVDAADGASQARERMASASARVFCFHTGFPNVEFYVLNNEGASRR